MLDQQSLISVIIPVHNGERYLHDAITSVLSQSYHPIEIIVVDDGSTDDSTAVVRSFGPLVRIYFQPKAGPGAARNLGVMHAQGDLFAFLDADDLWTPDKLAHQFAALQTNPMHDMVFGLVEQFISPDLPDAQRPALPAQVVMKGLHVGAMLIWRKRFNAVGPFATTWTVGEFIDWYGRAQALRLRATVLSEIVMRRRLHANNLMRRMADQRTDYARILKARLAVNRAHQ